jgi:hypothetical protein
MKPNLKHSFLALAGITLSVTAAKGADDFVDGDLCVAFYQTDLATDSVVQSNTYVVNLGPASLYRENTQNAVPVSTINTALASSNIGADLTEIFGSDWSETGRVRWCVVGGVSATGTTTSGDPARTNYFSRARASFATGNTGPGSTISTVSSTNRGNMSTAIAGFFRGNNDGITFVDSNTSATSINSVTLNTASVLLPIANNRSLEEYLPPFTLGLFFGQGIDPRQAFDAGALPGGGGVQGALDLYRILFTTTGADLTAGASTGNAVAGAGQYIGSLTIDSSGVLKIQGIGSAGTFSTWASTNNVTGGPNGDSDNDGISNLVEYALALNPAASDGAPGTFTGGTLSFAKRGEAVTNGDVTYAIQESDDLGVSDPWQNVTPTTNTTSTITYLLPSGSPKKFARLVVNSAP